MSPSRNRGKKKLKLRDYSQLVLSPDEKEALHAVAESGDQQPIVSAILGCILVEHELDILLRAKFKKRDDETWTKLTDERGPLRSFSAKITIGHAFDIYDDRIRHDLDIVRTIRNAFAHSRKLLTFSDPLIIAELSSSLLLKEKFKTYLHPRKDAADPLLCRAFFVIICLKLETAMLRKRARAGHAKIYRMKKKTGQSALRNALLNPYPLRIGELGLDQQSSPGDQNENPNPRAPQGLLAGLLPFLENKKK